MSSVVRLINETTAARSDVRCVHVTTFRQGPPALRAAVSIRGVAIVAVRLLFRRVDVLHLHLSYKGSGVRKAGLSTFARVLGVATVLHAHGGGFTAWFDGLAPRHRRVLRRALRAQLVIVLSEGLRAPYAQRLELPIEHVVALPNPVVIPDQAVDQHNDVPVTIAFLGRFSQAKGVYDLVRAVALVPHPVRQRLRVVLAGDGEDEQLRAEVSALGLDGVVVVAGWLDGQAKASLLAGAHVLALPSYHESMPMAVLEGMAYGLVPLVAPVGGLVDLVADGCDGIFVEAGDVPGLAAAIERLVNDDASRARMGAAARAKTAEHHSLPGWADRLATLWRGAYQLQHGPR